ncbi:Ulp1 protease family, carboxy-terminal domain protein [Arachis hypogaea]|nr:Ulp1 protease family, carboxy-terminal domain protein [Arachis hypogaea]
MLGCVTGALSGDENTLNRFHVSYLTVSPGDVVVTVMELLLTPPLPYVCHLHELIDQHVDENLKPVWRNHCRRPQNSPMVIMNPPPPFGSQRLRHGVAVGIGAFVLIESAVTVTDGGYFLSMYCSTDPEALPPVYAALNSRMARCKCISAPNCVHLAPICVIAVGIDFDLHITHSQDYYDHTRMKLRCCNGSYLSSPGVHIGQHPGESHFEPCNAPTPFQIHPSSTWSVSCARKSIKESPARGPHPGIEGSLFSAASCGSSRGANNQDSSHVAETVVTTVSGIKCDLERLSDVISRHEGVVLEIRDAIREMAADIYFLNLTSPTKGTCGSCSKNRKKKSMSRHLSSLTTSPAKPSPEVVDLTADTDGDPPAFHVEANVKRARDGLTGRHMCNDQLPGAHDVVNLGSLLSLKVERIPQNMDLVFHPMDAMNLSGLELAVATYIFSGDLPQSEILIDVGDCLCSRGALLTLVPRCEVVDDVLNVVVRMLTTPSEKQHWYLPTSIMQAAIDGQSLTTGNMTSLRNKYMRSKVDRVTRIYQPMWCDRHWYLMIIDVPRKKLIYLDSLRDPHQADARKTWMMRVALYLEGLTLGKSWLSGEGALRPRFSAFDFEEPDVPQQEGNSMDCGIWVAQWMIREHL